MTVRRTKQITTDSGEDVDKKDSFYISGWNIRLVPATMEIISQEVFKKKLKTEMYISAHL